MKEEEKARQTQLDEERKVMYREAVQNMTDEQLEE